jgi:hypothetical protein
MTNPVIPKENPFAESLQAASEAAKSLGFIHEAEAFTAVERMVSQIMGTPVGKAIIKPTLARMRELSPSNPYEGNSSDTANLSKGLLTATALDHVIAEEALQHYEFYTISDELRPLVVNLHTAELVSHLKLAQLNDEPQAGAKQSLLGFRRHPWQTAKAILVHE